MNNRYPRMRDFAVLLKHHIHIHLNKKTRCDTNTAMSALAEVDLKGQAVSGEAEKRVGETSASAGASGATGAGSQVETTTEEGCTLVAKWQGKTIELPELAKSTTIGEVKVGG